MPTVALIGPDGAGKSTIGARLPAELAPARVKTIYMGVNLEQSSLMLPTTRLVLAAKRARGQRPDMTASTHRVDRPARPRGRKARAVGSAKEGVRMVLWVAEEWFRQLVALAYRMRGAIVIFDRHFFADYYHYDVARGDDERTWAARAHGFVLKNLYPKPDLVVCLDAPGEVLFRRKGEATTQWLEQRRHQYLEVATLVPNFAVIDATQPIDQVTRAVADEIRNFTERQRA